MSEIVITPLAEWQAEMERRGKLDCKFVCPACGNEASPNDFKAVGADLQRAPVECIGRLNLDGGEGLNLPDCTWAAFGLLDICTVHVESAHGKPTPVFAFAPSEHTELNPAPTTPEPPPPASTTPEPGPTAPARPPSQERT
jgi:hypothetical protein